MHDEQQGVVLKDWWRWPLLPVAAIAGALVGVAALLLFLWLGNKMYGGFTQNSWYFRYVIPVAVSALFGYLYALISYAIAPRGKVIASTVMVTILGLFCLLGVLLAWFAPAYSSGRPIQNTVGAIATMIASIAAIVTAERNG